MASLERCAKRFGKALDAGDVAVIAKRSGGVLAQELAAAEDFLAELQEEREGMIRQILEQVTGNPDVDLKALEAQLREQLREAARISDNRKELAKIIQQTEYSALSANRNARARKDLIDEIIAEMAKPTEEAAPKPKGRIFDKDKAAEARARIKAKLGQLNAGIDPELLADIMYVAGETIENGARKFVEFAQQMINQFGDDIKPYLTSAYEAVRNYPGFDNEGMTHYGDVKVSEILDLAPQNEAEGGIDENQTGGDNATDEQPNRPAASPGDQAGVQATPGGRRDNTQQGSPQGAFDFVEAEQPENVPAAEETGNTEPDGIRGAAENVGDVGRPGETGNVGDGREGDRGEGTPDAGTGDTGGAAGEPRPGSVKDPENVSPGNPGPGNFHISDPEAIIGGGPVARFEKNKAAITLYQEILAEGRPATREEQAVLAGYTGWGSFGQELFQGTYFNPKPKEGWEERDAWLRETLEQSEWEGLQRSILNAHYTDPPTIQAMWAMLEKMGFRGGRVLEPSIGIGHFFGLMPEKLKSRSQLAGIELDPVTAGMAKLLYPDANIQQKGYQESQTSDNFYDVIIGNWPFDNQVVAERRYRNLSPLLHDFFFLKALDQTRPGGIVMGITSNGSMDKKTSTIRTALAKKGELIAAFRLPTGAFKQFAGTSVVTDIIILRKRNEEVQLVGDAGWIESVPYQTKNGEVFMNEYYVAHPDHVLGEVDFGHGTTRGREGLIVHRPDDLMERLQALPDKLSAGDYQKSSNKDTIKYITNHLDDRENSLVATADGLFIVRGEYLAPAEDVAKYSLKDAAATKKREDGLRALVNMRRAYAELIEAERGREGEPEILRRKLKGLYDAFTKKHGKLQSSHGLKYLKKIDDPFYPALAALEIDGKPALILTQSTTRARRSIENPSSQDAFVLARGESVQPTLAEVAAIAKKPEAAVLADLIAANAVFELPNGDIVPTDVYLSGNVRQRIRQARADVEEFGEKYQRNVDALEKVLPPSIPYFNIEPQMGASWVPTKVYEQYVAFMLGRDSTEGISVDYKVGTWTVRLPGGVNQSAEASTGFGTPYYSFSRLVNAAIRNQTVRVTETIDGVTVLLEEETKEANQKIANMREKFKEWIWSDPERRLSLEEEYNEVRNAYAIPSFDGSVLGFEGMALKLGDGPFELRRHQRDAIWRAVVTRKSLNAHEVGTGKTFTMGGIAVESRRYGIARKPMILAHNANSKSVAAEIQQMYPAAKVLYIDNLSPSTIDIKMRQIANDDWDAVVLPHSLISSLAFKEETLMEIAREEIAALEEEAILAAKDDGHTLTREDMEDEEKLKRVRSQTAKDLVRQRNKIIEAIKKQALRASKDGATPFEELGVDMILVDEAHEFKKPPISTRMSMKGLQKDSSQKSIQLSFITHYIRANNNGGNVHLFTGTPITNTITEAFHQMRYLMNEEMADVGVDRWDGWFGSFAEEVDDVELSAAGEYEPVIRLAKFINVPELRRMLGQYMDVVFSDDMPEMVPRRTKSGKTMADETLTDEERSELLNGRTEGAQDRPYKKIINDSADMTPEQLAWFEKIQQWAKEFRQGSGKQRKEWMQQGDPRSPIIYENLAAKVSFDARLGEGEENAGKEGRLADDPNSKASRVIRNVMDIYNSDDRTAQVIFTDKGISKVASRSVGPAGAKRQERYKVFSTVQDIVERLVKAGIPRDQIATVDGSTSKDKRKQIADAMNDLKIRVVIGSSQALGVGVNMQKNLRAMHHMDAPWMPGELEQRNGRGQRQGNQWNTVLEFRYLTDRLDGRRWQVLSIKDRFIKAFLKADDSIRTIEGDAVSDDEEGGILETFSQAAGDPRILVREKLKKQVAALHQKQRIHDAGIFDAKQRRQWMIEQIKSDKRLLDLMQESAEPIAKLLRDTKGDLFSITIDGRSYTTRKDADAAIKEFAKLLPDNGNPQYLGSFGGHPLKITMQYGATSITADVGGLSVSSGPTMGSLEATLRRAPERTDALIEKIAQDEKSVVRLEDVAKEPFREEENLKKRIQMLDDLEKDIQQNPVPPPAWLRNGAAVDTEVRWKGQVHVVTGHRWTETGWFVTAERDGQVSEIPYLEVKDEQGLQIYDEVPFQKPVVVEKDKSKDDKMPKVPAPPQDDAGGFSVTPVTPVTPASRPEQPADPTVAPRPRSDQAEAEPSGNGDGQRFNLAEFPHSKTGETMYVAAFAAREESSAFTKAKQVARKHRGYYSRYKGDGAIPGFLFKTEEARQAFLDDMGGGPVFAGEAPRIRVWHGTPHTLPAVATVTRANGEQVEYPLGEPLPPEVVSELRAELATIQEHPLGRFRLDKVGTGEGAQTYGWGLYFAEAEGVAKNVRDGLTANPTVEMTNSGDPSEWAAHLVRMHGNEETAKLVLAGEDGSGLDVRPQRGAAYEAIVSGEYKKHDLPVGRLYQVDIFASPDELIDLDKRMSEQSPMVLAVMESLRSSLINPDVDFSRESGLAFIVQLQMGLGSSPATVSAMLRQAGIKGSRYKDQFSRDGSEGTGTYNYVIFDENLIHVVNVFGAGAKPGNGMPVARLKKILGPTIKKWQDGPNVHLIQSMSDLPSHLRASAAARGIVNIRGVTDGNDIYLIADFLGSKAEAAKYLSHEAVGHYGIERMLSDKEFDILLRLVKRMLKSDAIIKEAAEKVRARRGNNLSDREFLREVVATVAERTIKHPLLVRLYAAIRRFLRDVLGMNLPFNGRELQALLLKASRSMQRGSMPGNDSFRGDSAEYSFAGEIRPDNAEKNAALREQDVKLWTRAKKYLKRELAPGGLLPDAVFKENVKRNSELNAVEFDVSHLVGKLEAAIKEDFQLRVNALEDRVITLMNRALAGGENVEGLPNKTRLALAGLRTYIDELSNQYSEAELRRIRMMTDRMGAEEKIILQGFLAANMVEPGGPGPQFKAAATRQRNKIIDDAAAQAGAMWRARNVTKNMHQVMSEIGEVARRIEMIRTILGNLGEYVHRSYRVHDDPKWFAKLDDSVIEDARDFLKSQYFESTQDEAEAERLAEVMLHELLKNGTAYDSMGAFVQESKLGAKDLSVLQRRKKIAPEIRALFGEYVDPRVRFAKSATKMARLIHNQHFLDKVLELGMGVFLFEGMNRPPAATRQIAAEGSEVYAPLNGLWTFPEVDQAFVDALNKEQMEDWYRTIVQLNGLVKYGKTVLSPTTAARNWQSAAFFTIANGHFDWSHMGKSIKGMQEYFTQNGEDAQLKYLRRLKQLGVIYDTAYAGEMMRLIDDALIDSRLLAGKEQLSIRKGLNLVQRFYSYGDDFWKIIGYENEKQLLMKHAGLSEAEAETEAAERIRNTYPTYSMTGKGVQSLRRLPVAGTFVSFPAEIVRTSFNMTRYVAKDYNTPGMRPLALRRAAGLLIVAALAYALQEWTKNLLGLDDDDQEAIRVLAPHWQRNSNLAFLGRDDEGRLKYIDLSYIDPYNYLKRPLMAIFSGDPWEDKLVEAGAELLGPFFGEDIAFGAIREIASNKKQSGGKVYNEADGPADQTADIALHLVDALKPGVAGNIERIYKALRGDVTRSGKAYDLVDELWALAGYRIATFDPKVSLYYRTIDFDMSISNSTQMINRVLTDPNKISVSDIEKAIARSNKSRDKAFREMNNMVNAARTGGMREAEIEKVLRDSGMSYEHINAAMSGEPNYWRPTKQAEQRAVKRAEGLFGNKRELDIHRRYDDARRISGRLRDEYESRYAQGERSYWPVAYATDQAVASIVEANLVVDRAKEKYHSNWRKLVDDKTLRASRLLRDARRIDHYVNARREFIEEMYGLIESERAPDNALARISRAEDDMHRRRLSFLEKVHEKSTE